MITRNIKFPKLFIELSKELGVLRSKMSKNYYNEGSEKYRGEDENKISSLGVLGELIARYDLSERNIPFKSTTLVADKPLAEPDIYLLVEKISIDVKGVGFFTKELRVNTKAHNNPDKRVDKYWFIKIDSYKANANSYLVNYEDVSGWEIEQKKYTEAYCRDIEEIKIYEGMPDVLQPQEWMNRK